LPDQQFSALGYPVPTETRHAKAQVETLPYAQYQQACLGYGL